MAPLQNPTLTPTIPIGRELKLTSTPYSQTVRIVRNWCLGVLSGIINVCPILPLQQGIGRDKGRLVGIRAVWSGLGLVAAGQSRPWALPVDDDREAEDAESVSEFLVDVFLKDETQRP